MPGLDELNDNQGKIQSAVVRVGRKLTSLWRHLHQMSYCRDSSAAEGRRLGCGPGQHGGTEQRRSREAVQKQQQEE